MSECKHDQGYFVKRVEIFRVYYDMDGNLWGSDNGENDGHSKTSKTVYCAICEKPIKNAVLINGTIVIKPE